MLMKHLKQPIAYQANREDRCSGHFFEGQFYSGALLDENAVVAAIAYVGLNPMRAHHAAYRAVQGSFWL
jgi:putative transposase